MKALKKYTHQRISRLRKLLAAYEKFEESEALHHIRVEIKKIKAVLFVLGASTNDFNAHKKFLPFREIFRKAGAIREREVLLSLAAKHGIKANEAKRNTTESPDKQIFLFDTQVFISRVKRKGRQIENAAGEVSQKSFEKMIGKLLKRVKKSLYPKVLTAVLHKTRKNIKEILYLSDVSQTLGDSDYQFFATIAERIGELHDKETLVKSLGAAARSQKNLKAGIRADHAAIRKLAMEFYS